jgi:type IV secretory pathway protease TraF
MNARTFILGLTLAAAALTVAPAAIDRRPMFIWNASASAPIGLYRVLPEDRLAIPDLVVVMPPAPLAALLADRGYLPRGVPLLKRSGRPLPVWQGCRMIADGEVFLMNWLSADSLDGRYFGSLPAASIVGRAVPIWTFEEPR